MPPESGVLFLSVVSWDVFCEASSLLNLLVISLERLYAVRSPFRHRTLTTRSSIYSLGFIWVTSAILFVLYFALLNDSKLSVVPILISCPFFLVVLVIICAAYILICLQTRQNFPEGRNERRAQQNKKLTKTLLKVTFISLICWLPALIMSFISVILFWTAFLINSYLNVRRFSKALQYACANSVVNCTVHTFTSRCQCSSQKLRNAFLNLLERRMRIAVKK